MVSDRKMINKHQPPVLRDKITEIVVNIVDFCRGMASELKKQFTGDHSLRKRKKGWHTLFNLETWIITPK